MTELPLTIAAFRSSCRNAAMETTWIPSGLEACDQILMEQVTVERDDELGAATTSGLEENVIVRIAAPLRGALELNNVRSACEEDAKIEDVFERQTVQRAHEYFDVFMQDRGEPGVLWMISFMTARFAPLSLNLGTALRVASARKRYEPLERRSSESCEDATPAYEHVLLFASKNVFGGNPYWTLNTKSVCMGFVGSM
jgi:hypothetical protein